MTQKTFHYLTEECIYGKMYVPYTCTYRKNDVHLEAPLAEFH